MNRVKNHTKRRQVDFYFKERIPYQPYFISGVSLRNNANTAVGI